MTEWTSSRTRMYYKSHDVYEERNNKYIIASVKQNVKMEIKDVEPKRAARKKITMRKVVTLLHLPCFFFFFGKIILLIAF